MSDEQAIAMIMAAAFFGFIGYIIGWSRRGEQEDARQEKFREAARRAALIKVCEPKTSQINQIRNRFLEDARELVESSPFNTDADRDVLERILELKLPGMLEAVVDEWLEENNYVPSEENADRVIQALKRKYPDITTLRH